MVLALTWYKCLWVLVLTASGASYFTRDSGGVVAAPVFKVKPGICTPKAFPFGHLGVSAVTPTLRRVDCLPETLRDYCRGKSRVAVVADLLTSSRSGWDLWQQLCQSCAR